MRTTLLLLMSAASIACFAIGFKQNADAKKGGDAPKPKPTGPSGVPGRR